MAARPAGNTERLAALLDHLPDALLLVDAGGTIVNANARALEAFRAEGAAAPLVGRILGELIPTFGHGVADPMRRFDAGRRAAPERMLARALDGTTFPIDVSRALVPWGGGDEHLMLVLHEVVEATTQTELHRANQQTQAVLRATEEAVCGVDAQGRVVLANPSAARLLGARVGDVAGKDLHAIALHTRLDGSSYPAEESPVADTLRTGRRHQRRREVIWRRDGSPVPVDLSTIAIKEGEEIVGAIATFTDVTRLVEEERRRARLTDLLDRELRAGLVALRGPGASVSTVDELLAVVDEAVDYERLMSGQAQLRKIRAEIGNVVADAVATAAGLARRHDVLVDVLSDAYEVEVDVPRMALALGELIRAAIRSSAAGSAVAVTTAGSGDRVRILVRETRVSAPTEESPMLRWLRPRRPGVESPDPDLAFVQIVVERHGGRFLLEPAGGGARSYVIELPMLRVPDEPGPPESRPGGGRRRARPVADAASNGATIPAPAKPAAVNPAARLKAGTTSTTELPLRAILAAAAGERVPELLVWPAPHDATTRALGRRGWSPVAVTSPADLTVHVRAQTAALLIDPLAGPVSRRSLAQVRAAAASAGLPVLVVAGLEEVSAAAGSAADPAMLLEALRIGGPEATRVLVVEDDPAVAFALGAGLQRRGMHPVYARTEAEAMLRAAISPPDLVLLGLALEPTPKPGIVDWLRNSERLVATPVVAYTTDALGPGHQARLQRGETALVVQVRAEGDAVEVRLVDLVLRLAGPR